MEPACQRCKIIEDGLRLFEFGARRSTRSVGCALLFCQGLGIACYCLLQKRLVRGDGAEAAWGPVTVTAHAMAVSTMVTLAAAAVDGLVGIEREAPLGAAALRQMGAPAAAGAVLYVRRAEVPLMNRGDAVAATWIFRGDESRRRRG